MTTPEPSEVPATPEPDEAPAPAGETRSADTPSTNSGSGSTSGSNPTSDSGPTSGSGLRAPQGCAEWTVVILGVVWIVLAIIFVVALVVRLSA